MIRMKVLADGTKRHQVYGRRSGKQVYLGTVNSEREAASLERRHLVTQEQIAAGELPPEIDQRRTFGDAVKVWLKALEETGSRSREEYASRVDLYMLPDFEDVPITRIRKPDVIAWRDRLQQKVSGSTVNSALGTLSSAFSFFVEREWLEKNPCSRVRKVAHVARIFPWITTGEAITRLLSECTNSIRPIVAVLVGTGMRLDEALHLRWDDIDLEHRIITVHRGRKGTTKAGRARRVPILDSTLPVLRAMKLTSGRNTLLWPGGRPGKALSQPSVRLPFKTAVEMAELPPELRLHDLRHTFASMYLADGGDIFKLSKILGHSSVAITEKTYAHLMPTAFEADYGRVWFAMPSDGKVIAFQHS